MDAKLNSKSMSKWPNSGTAIFKARERDDKHIVSAYL